MKENFENYVREIIAIASLEQAAKYNSEKVLTIIENNPGVVQLHTIERLDAAKSELNESTTALRKSKENLEKIKDNLTEFFKEHPSFTRVIINGERGRSSYEVSFSPKTGEVIHQVI